MTHQVTSSETLTRRGRVSVPAFTMSDSALEAVKWLALILMTADHVDKYLMAGNVSGLFDAGRLAMPLFAAVFGINMARPRADIRAHYGKTILRLLASGLVAAPACLALGGLGWGWWPLNVMGMFACAAGVMWLTERKTRIACASACLLFVIGGAFVEYWWPGLVLCLAAWRFAQRPSWWAATTWLLAATSLYIINRNWWALGAVPILLIASRLDVTIPRYRLLFYVYYPAHLWLVLLIAHFGR